MNTQEFLHCHDVTDNTENEIVVEIKDDRSVMVHVKLHISASAINEKKFKQFMSKKENTSMGQLNFSNKINKLLFNVAELIKNEYLSKYLK